MRKLDARKLAREKSLFRYSSALERADFDTVTAVLREAERDPVLAQMIEEINLIFERETIRLSPSLNHSSNHHQKELLMTTIILPRRQNPLQRWLPITLAAACVSVLFIGALLMRPIRPGGSLAGLQTGATNTPTAAASPTMIPTTLSTFTPTPVAMVEASALPPTVIPPDVQSSVGGVGAPVCGGTKIISEDTIVHAQPSNNSVAIGRVPAGTKAETLATGLASEGDTSVPQTQWFFIKADVGGNSVQGWVSANTAQPIDPANPCPSDAVVVGAVVPTLIPANTLPSAGALPTIVPPGFSVAALPTCSPITVDGTTLHVINQVDKAATIYAAPLTMNSNASVVGELPAKGEAILLYQQYDRQSDPIGALWYLIMTNGEGDKQVTGWVSANSITAADACASVTVSSDAAPVTISKTELGAITGVAVTSSAQTGTCRIINTTTQPATVFAAPLTIDSNAPVVGTFPVQGDAVVIFQNYDTQSAPVGALWYLVTVDVSNGAQITGWISANSINSSSTCAPEQLVGISISPVSISTGEVSAATIPSVDVSKPSMCQISNTSGKAITMFAAPLTANSNAPAVGEFPVGSEATLILQNADRNSNPVGAVWYLITLTNSGDKQLTGWISSNDIKLPESCTPQVSAISVPAPVQAAVQADTAIAPTTNTTGPVLNCLVNTYNNESVPVFSGPNESLVVNNLPPDMPATVLYQQVDPRTNLSWYLILAVSKEGKQVSGWVSSDSVSIDTTHCSQKP